MEYILASASPRRQELLARLPIAFTVDPVFCDETLPEDTPAAQAAELLAVRKAAAAAKLHPNAVVIGADTTVVIEDTILGKPKDRAECCAMLSLLSGRTHSVYTGVAIFWEGKSLSFTEQTEVGFFPLSEREIIAYADTDEPYDKAGAYGIQGNAGLFIAGIHGDYYNVMGLPIARLYRQMRKLGICS